MIENRQPDDDTTLDEPRLVPGCDACARLLNLWLTGEWTCPRCHGPSPDVAVRLRTEYAKTCGRL
jgi:hypothetical protein